MGLFLLGSNHKLTPPSQLQLLARQREQLFARLLRMHRAGDITGGLMLATCNRLEVVVDLGDDKDQDQSSEECEALEELRDCLEEVAIHEKGGADVTDYMLRVSTGLESMVIGEDQILGQLRESFKQAEEHKLLSAALRRMRTQLMEAARDIRQQTGLTRTKASVAALGAKLMARKVGESRHGGGRFVVIGAGETGQLAIKTLARLRQHDIIVVNRSMQKAEALARHHDLQAMSLADFMSNPPQVDGILVAVHSKEPFLGAEHLQGAQVVVDISMPSVLQRSIHDQSGVEVLDLDALASYAQEEEDQRSSAAQIAEDLVQARAQKLHEDLSQPRRDFGAIIEQHVERALDELNTALTRGLRHLSDKDQEELRALIQRTAKRNAHFHLQDLRELSVR